MGQYLTEVQSQKVLVEHPYSYLTVDKNHQLVSTFTRLTSSPDQVVGAADLRLCDEDKWRESVKVCFELFSTAAASDRVAAEMQWNSV